MYTPNLTSDDQLKAELTFFLNYFLQLKNAGKLSEGLRYIRDKHLQPIYDIVFNKKK